ncbi:MAG: hypothetical protein NC089_10365 [Bacteroides sp.]|nr:hypothetical protein [Bacteroides sp.]MCM1550463.1 hypothetical protein [Clostridium sp.]
MGIKTIDKVSQSGFKYMEVFKDSLSKKQAVFFANPIKTVKSRAATVGCAKVQTQIDRKEKDYLINFINWMQ